MSCSGAVSVTSSTVTAYGMNSCSSGWFHTGGTFTNYCPNCGHYGCLAYNPKHTREGEFSCLRCDSDYCLCGKEKMSYSSVYLIKATNKTTVANTTVPVSANITPTQPPTLIELIKIRLTKNLLGGLIYG